MAWPPTRALNHSPRGPSGRRAALSLWGTAATYRNVGALTWRRSRREMRSRDPVRRYATMGVTSWLISRLVTPRSPNFCTYFGVVFVTRRGFSTSVCHKPRGPSAHTEERWSTPRKRD